MIDCLAVKRLMREAAELSQPAPEYFAAPLEVWNPKKNNDVALYDYFCSFV